MQAPEKIYICKGRVYIEQDALASVLQSKEDSQMRCMYEILWCIKTVYLETDTSCIGLGTKLLWVKDNVNCRHDDVIDNEVLQPFAFANKSLSIAEWCYSNIEQEALGILCELEKLYKYYFVKEVCIITDHKLLYEIFNKDVAMLSQQLQSIMLASESVYWININVDMKQCATCMEYQQTQLHEQITPQKVQQKPWEVVCNDIFTIKNNTLLCIVDDYIKFPVVKKADGLLADKLIRAALCMHNLGSQRK